MANTQWKRTTLGKGYAPASSLDLSQPKSLRREPFELAHRAQDSVLDGRRVLASQHAGGVAEWLVDNEGTGDPTTQAYPDATTWRVVSRARTELAPGQGLVVRVLAARSGPSEFYGVVDATTAWHNAGNGGAIKVELDYENVAGQTASLQVQHGILPTGDPDGLEDTAAASVWGSLVHKVTTDLRPSSESAELAKWSEWPSIDVKISHRAGARILHATVSEEAGEHVVEDDVTDETTVNGVSPAGPWPVTVRKPLEEEPDGATYEEHRHGVHRLLYVAARQTERVGPRIAHWSAWDEAAAAPADTQADPVEITSTTFSRVSWSGSQSTWDADAPGFYLPPTRRAPENLPSRVDGAASSPVRLRVYCRFSGAGSNTGTVRFWATARSWVDVEIGQASVGTTWQWVTATGWLETAVASDDAYPVLQDFAKTTGGTLQILDWDVSYGEFETGLG